MASESVKLSTSNDDINFTIAPDADTVYLASERSKKEAEVTDELPSGYFMLMICLKRTGQQISDQSTIDG